MPDDFGTGFLNGEDSGLFFPENADVATYFSLVNCSRAYYSAESALYHRIEVGT
jgi:hypothetical protein